MASLPKSLSFDESIEKSKNHNLKVVTDHQKEHFSKLEIVDVMIFKLHLICLCLLSGQDIVESIFEKYDRCSRTPNTMSILDINPAIMVLLFGRSVAPMNVIRLYSMSLHKQARRALLYWDGLLSHL